MIEYVSEKLVEIFDINRENPKNFQISKRTIQADLAILRADAPKGFGAKIGVKNGSYFYEDKNFSIHQSKLSEAALLLRQFKGLPHFDLLE